MPHQGLQGLFGGGGGGGGGLSGLFPDLLNAPPPTLMAQLALLGLQDPLQFAQAAAAQGPPPTDLDLGGPLTDTRIDPTRGAPTPGPAPTVQTGDRTKEILDALAAIEIPEAPAQRPLPNIPSAPSIPAPRGGPDPQLLAQLLQLLQGQGTRGPQIPSLGQLIGG